MAWCFSTKASAATILIKTLSSLEGLTAQRTLCHFVESKPVLYFFKEIAHGPNFIATIWFVVKPPAWRCCSKFPPHDVIIVCASLMMHYEMYLALLDMSWLPRPPKMLPNSLRVVLRMLLIQNLSSALCGNRWEVCAINDMPGANKFSFNRPITNLTMHYTNIPQCTIL